MKYPILLFFLFHLYLSLPTNLSNYSYPQPYSSLFFEKIAIFATNDIHGHILPSVKTIPGTNITYRTGGLTMLSSYFETLKSEWGQNLMWLDAGDEYQGTIESNQLAGEPMVRFFNYMNWSDHFAAAVGNHDFDFGFRNMSEKFAMANYSYLSANIYENGTDKKWNFSNLHSHTMLKAGSLKVGVIGLTTTSTPHTTATDVSRIEFRKHLEITKEESRILRENGADIVLLVCHVGMACAYGNIIDNYNLTMRNMFTVTGTNCEPTDELYSFLNELPDGVLDGVIGGHKHTIVHHWVNNIPVVIGDCNARHFNVLYLTYDKIKKRVRPEFSEIEGPVPVCEQLFENERTCFVNNTVVPLNYEKVKMINLTYHNKLVKDNEKVVNFLDPYFQKAEYYKSLVLGYINRTMENSNKEESSMGNFITDAVQKHTKADVVFLNRGMMRISWLPGNLTFYDLYETIPFEDEIVTFECTGEELIKIMTTLQKGALGLYATSGFLQHICSHPRHLLNISFYHGKPIIHNQIYKVGTIKFLIFGGDDFADVLTYYKPRNVKYFQNVREVLAEYIQELGILNGPEHKFVNPENPRIIFHHSCPINHEFRSGSKMFDKTLRLVE